MTLLTLEQEVKALEERNREISFELSTLRTRHNALCERLKRVRQTLITFERRFIHDS